jgi:transposase
MRQDHRAGEKVFVDHGGQRLRNVGPTTGAVAQVEFFGAVLGASSYAYAEATRTQQLPELNPVRLMRSPTGATCQGSARDGPAPAG